MTAAFADIFTTKRLIVCCGSGGVGKTTTSAAIGLEAALRGKRTLVLTIDPAKRLANALGLESLASRPQLISIPGKTAATLHAAQLDAKRTFDGIIERFAPDDDTRSAILNNPLYEQLSSMIAGSQEYMAMEKLYELAGEHDWDFLVLDTPPARNAMDFLDAPQRMVRAITDSFLKYFVRPSVMAGRIGSRAFGGVSRRLTDALGRFAGVQFIHELFELVSATVSLLDGFSERAAATERILKEETTAFLLITSPRPAAISDAYRFYERFARHRLPLAGCVINRTHPPFARDRAAIERIRRNAISSGNRLAVKLVDNALRYQELSDVDRHEIGLLRTAIPLCIEIPLFPQDVCDIDGLKKIADHLCSRLG